MKKGQTVASEYNYNSSKENIHELQLHSSHANTVSASQLASSAFWFVVATSKVCWKRWLHVKYTRLMTPFEAN